MAVKKQRGHGEGTIRLRSDGRWEARLTLADGKRKSLFGKTRAEVARKLTDALHDRERGLLIGQPADARQTVETYLRSWFASILPTIDQKTAAMYEQRIETHLIPALGRIKLIGLSATQIEACYHERIADGYAASSVRGLHQVLAQALNAAVRAGVLPRNVATLASVPRATDQPPMQVFDATQARTFLDAARGHWLEALFIVAISTGMRQGELLALRWSDVDLDAKRLSVRQSLQEYCTPVIRRPANAPRWVFKRPKTDKSRRQVAFSEMVADALRTHRVKQAMQRLRMGEAWQDYDLIFCGALGQPLFHQSVRRSFHLLVRQTDGLPDIRFHDLRHTAATLLLRQRVNPKVVSEMLGHTSIATTLDIYSHVLPDMQEDAATAMAAALGS